jgi:ribose 5-phosphate isomerase B
MKIAAAADHAGVNYKNRIVRVLRELGHDVEDMGTDGEDAVDYPDFAAKVANAVARGEVDRGVLICSTGIGMSIAANRVKGVRAALCRDEHAAEMSRSHNDSNVLCLAGLAESWEEVAAILKKWLDTPFDGGRHERRISKLDRF